MNQKSQPTISNKSFNEKYKNQKLSVYLLVKKRPTATEPDKLVEREVYIIKQKILQKKGGKQIFIDFKSLEYQKKDIVINSAYLAQQTQVWMSKNQHRLVAKQINHQNRFITLYFATEAQALNTKRWLIISNIFLKATSKQIFKKCVEQTTKKIQYSLVHKMQKAMTDYIDQKNYENKLIEQQSKKNLAISKIRQFFSKNTNHQKIHYFLTDWLNKSAAKQIYSEEFLDLRFTKIHLLKKILPEDPVVFINFWNEGVGRDKSRVQKPIYPISESETCLIYLINSQINHISDLPLMTEKHEIYVQVRSKKENKIICKKTILLNEILYRNIYGKYFSIGLEPVGQYQVQLNKIDQKQEMDYVLNQFPFQIQFSSILNNGKIDGLSFKQERRFQFLTNLTYIPNHYGIEYHIQKLTQQNVRKYQKIFNIPSSNVITMETMQRINQVIIQEYENQEAKSENAGLIGLKYLKKLFPGRDFNVQLKVYNKIELYRLAERGFAKKFRLPIYENLLGIVRLKLYIQKTYDQIAQQTNNIHYIDLRNFTQDYNRMCKDFIPLYKIMTAYLSVKNMNLEKLPLLYVSNLLNIAKKIIELVKFHYLVYQGMNQKSEKFEKLLVQRSFWLLIGFITQVGDYYRSNNKLINSHLVGLRLLSKTLLKEFNYVLNRELIGLQNLMAPKLLDLFSNEHPELVYRIWDILIYYNRQEPKKRQNILIQVAFTYLVFLESNNLTNYIPINNFISSVTSNINKVVINPTMQTQVHQQTLQVLQRFQQRNELIRNLADEKYIRRFIFSEPDIQIADQNSQPTRNTHSKELRKFDEPYVEAFPLHTISYPLPSPNFVGSPIRYVHLMIKKLNIYNSLGLQPFEMYLKTYTISGQAVNDYKIIGGDKLTYLNYYIKIQNTYLIEFILQNKKVRLLTQKINLVEGYHKDTVYKKHIRLFQDNPDQRKNISESGIDIIFALESERTRQNDYPYKRYADYLLASIIDYDLQENQNLPIKEMSHLYDSIEKIKNPLDEYGKSYKSLKITAFGKGERQWVRNSNITMQQLKSHFYKIFSQKEQKQYKLLWSTFYKEFSYNNEFQFFQLGKFLLNLVLMSKTSRHDKINFIFTLVAHYQNTSKKELTVQSLNSIYEQLYIYYQYLNPCPYLSNDQNNIISAFIIFTHSDLNNKSIRHKGIDEKDVTDILKTWVYICYVKYGTKDIILGDNQNLKILKNLFDYATIKKIEERRGCRIQILYRVQKQIHNWICQIDRDFKVIKDNIGGKLFKRGQKVFNKHPQYLLPNNNSSQAQLLYTCQNIFPLTNQNSFNFHNVLRNIQQNPLLNYYLSTQTQFIDVKQKAQKLQLTISVYIDRILKKSYALNSSLPNSISVIQNNTTLRQVRQIIQTRQEYKRQLQKMKYYKIQYVLAGTILNDEEISFKQVSNIVSKATKFIQLHYLADKPSAEQSQYDRPEIGNYVSLALYRHQNCVQQWKYCNIQSLQQKQAKIIFADYPQEQFVVPEYQLINLQHQKIQH